MQKMGNSDLRTGAGLAIRSDMRDSINELIDRLNKSYSDFFLYESDTFFNMFMDYYNQLVVIFNFLSSCLVMSKRSYNLFYNELYDMYVSICDEFILD